MDDRTKIKVMVIQGNGVSIEIEFFVTDRIQESPKEVNGRAACCAAQEHGYQEARLLAPTGP